MRLDRTPDRFLGGRVAVTQPARGYRAGMDAILLAAAVPPVAGPVLDMGCGAGTVMLCAAARLAGLKGIGLEYDPDMAALARENVAANGLEGQLEVVEGNAMALPEGWQNRFDTVMSNPPYFDVGAISPPGEGRAAAYLASQGLKGWLTAMVHCARPRGRVLLIHRAAELGRILAVLERQTGEISVLPLHPRHGEAASRVIVTARKGLRPGPLRLLAGQVLHEGEGASGFLRGVEAGGAIELCGRVERP